MHRYIPEMQMLFLTYFLTKYSFSYKGQKHILKVTIWREFKNVASQYAETQSE